MSKEYLIKILKENHVFEQGDFTLASGKKSNYYVNMKKNKNRVNNLLEIPKEVYLDVPKLVIVGFEEMIIENYKSILEYEDYFVRINTHIGIININGFNLRLENMTNDDIKVIERLKA